MRIKLRSQFVPQERHCAAEGHFFSLGTVAVTDDERLREVARLIVEAFHLSNTRGLASVHRVLGLAAIEAAREVPVSLDPIYPPGVVPLRRPRPRTNGCP